MQVRGFRAFDEALVLINQEIIDVKCNVRKNTPINYKKKNIIATLIKVGILKPKQCIEMQYKMLCLFLCRYPRRFVASRISIFYHERMNCNRLYHKK